ncbi:MULTISPECIES: CaiB/BaiF CoA transferase family protein [unclassified Candidatus Frackibacter]|uniref:CaiB/BaiF CoA transferase family protein n=1 Tax=unclassified Candidatus Frackibacter TaxID=2648818 RepID=UPI00079CB244|nr:MULTISPECIES: CaiB/BaiF CoA-transferase family protein [unclassified Candidatus Frackibacter]KXS45278.1 MAG: formyl-CoA transferase [Candidatus Frackibacter sp. T328-2]SDC79021.1 CoA:oxalate CoA-transferase [Candidatus Frackibacter sp. WG11]SEM91789.1 CoA:oxalate CoA-transferase [Candidatus Frackibacter sp. WG12]SFM01551.1 CoA:oxalate CoA-transferase [Candidatus Frackibacter sp. WG13]
MTQDKPLKGVRVLDMTRVLAGPYCTMMLANLGADVIKVERPEVGDDARSFGPFFEDGEESAYFASLNSGKRSIELNLKDEKDIQTFKELIKKVDVVAENFRPGTMEKLGLGYETLKEINPEIIYAATSGFGHSGPDSKKAAYDMIVQAASGVMSITGYPDGPPVRVGVSVGDIVAGMFTASGILAALYQRTITGEGQKVDVSMLDGQVAILENAIARYMVDGEAPKPLGAKHPSITPFQAFEAKDGWFVIAAGNDTLWAKLCQAIEREDLIDDSRFKTNADRSDNIDELNEVLGEELAKKTVDEWVEIIDNHGVPTSPINSIDDLFDYPQIEARNMLVGLDDYEDDMVVAGNPIKMTNVPEEDSKPRAPKLGEHTEEVIEELLDGDKPKIEAV